MLCCSTLILYSCGGTPNTNGGGGQVEQPKSPNFQIQVSKNNVTLRVGDKQNLSAIVKDKNSTGQYYSGPIYWQSSNDDLQHGRRAVEYAGYDPAGYHGEELRYCRYVL